jgi:hypothetical protein
MTGNELYFLLIIGLVVIVLGCFCALVYFLWRELRVGGAPPAHTQSDLTNMMILFQTMRDILTQQKDLAREFNISIDRKVNEVRRLIQSTGDVRSDLERTKRELAALATRTRNDLSALERRLQGVDHSTESVLEEEPAPEESDDPEPMLRHEAPLEIIPEEEPADEPDLIDRWRFTETIEEVDGIEIEEDVDYEGDDSGNGHDVELTDDEVRETRAAYRDLLNLQPSGTSSLRGPTSSDVLDAGGESNGGHYLTPIQKRVYEYSDAGMRVPEIARELGVGKGEVRLILSLRQDRDG